MKGQVKHIASWETVCSVAHFGKPSKSSEYSTCTHREHLHSVYILHTVKTHASML